MFKKILIANRGEIACRILRTLKKMSVGSVAVYSEADRQTPHVLDADEAVCIGGPAVKDSYLDMQKIIDAALLTGAEAIHPGYGFLSENAEFAALCEENGLAFIGPEPRHIREFGLKHEARRLAEENGVPLLPGTGLLADLNEAVTEAVKIGYPVMLKSTAGGGGIGMALCRSEEDLAENFRKIQRLGENNFADSGIFLERFVEEARHVEVQIFGDGKGKAVALGDRDCSLQRRNQKVVEETPTPGLPEAVRSALHEAALRLVRAAGYRSAGTVEFVYDARREEFSFLEVNTRLQVEHTVTEEVFGVDLVEWMILLSAGEMPDLDELTLTRNGAAVQVRVYAEDPGKDFRPTGGVLTSVEFPEDIRLESWIGTGTEVSSFYDPLLAKIIVKGADRKEALGKMEEALRLCRIYGLETNLPYLQGIWTLEDFRKGSVRTSLLNGFSVPQPACDVLSPGTATTVQDWPGRRGYWQVGVPPSGPMDDLNFRIGNRILGNADDAAGLEITLSGPTLSFRSDTRICLTGAALEADLDGEPVPMNTAVSVKQGQTLTTGMIKGAGQRAYLQIRGGFDVPEYLGSRSTFTLGVFGGHGGRVLRTGDVLRFFADPAAEIIGTELLPENIPLIGNAWDIRVLYGPHGAPEFFTEEDMDTFFSTSWKVHYNSDRTGVRLIGPSPRWARKDGGEAGLHPSNIHDNAYMIGSVDFTGDMPVILGPDGPSLGGFVCPVTIISTDLWKMGQLKSDDTIRFRLVDSDSAKELDNSRKLYLNDLTSPAELDIETVSFRDQPVILRTIEATEFAPRVVCRRSGDKAVLIEFGEAVLDISLRFQIHALMLQMESEKPPGVLEMTPGIRSLQIQYDYRIVDTEELLDEVEASLQALEGCENWDIPSRIVHLPLSWDDPSTRKAIEKYTTTVRPGAPWCPSNIEFIRRINGLKDIDEVQKILFSASYLVMGLGDVYLGAPVATPLDPTQRLVTTKYNPARTWTPENAVGIGGAYLCVYGMEGPGGYQFVGRTVQMWNRYHQTELFEKGKPWLLRFFDQIRFYPVSAEELETLRRDFPLGLVPLKVEETTFRLSEYQQYLENNQAEIAHFRKKQRHAFAEEREEWKRTGQANYSSEPVLPESSVNAELSAGCLAIETPVTGSVWKINYKAGATIRKGEPLAVMESMKTEIPVPAPCTGVLVDLFCSEGDHVPAGGLLAGIKPEESTRSAS